MKINLTFKDGIISGDLVDTVKQIFPETINSFTQRKTYHEYYYSVTMVELTMEKLQSLYEKDIKVTIFYDLILED